MVTASKEEISKNVKSFFKLYLQKNIELIKGNNAKIGTLNAISYPELDFVFLFKFIRAELDHLKSLDLSILDKEVRFLFKNATETVTALSSFKRSYISADILFNNHFVEFNDEAKTINTALNQSRTSKSTNSSKANKISIELKHAKNTTEDEIQAYKDLNRELADTFQKIENARIKLEEIVIDKKDFDDRYYPAFADAYKKISGNIIASLTKQVAFFSFSTDRDLWKNASRSKKIMHFFEYIKESGDMNLKKYMEYSLAHQTSEKSQDGNQIKFRKQLTASIDIIKLFYLKQESAKKAKTS